MSCRSIKTCITKATTILFSNPNEIQLHRNAIVISHLEYITCVFLTRYPGSTMSRDFAQITTLSLIKVKVI